MDFKFNRGRYIVTILMAICFMFGIFTTAFAAAEFPPKPTNDIYVVDQANVIKPDAKAQMLSIARDLNQKTKAQVVVVTVKSLGGMDIESYSNQLFREWGIGDKKENNGILFIVAPNDRKMRIEIGRGLEGRIPDMVAGRIMDEYAKPYFSKGDFNSGILNTFKALVAEAGAEYGVEGVSGEQAAKVAPKKEEKPSLLALFLALVFWQQLLVIIIILIILWICFNLGIIPFIGGGSGGDGGFFDSFGGGSSGGGGSSDDW